jgi:glycine/D-amino acid oxidase-like deaminating enzyme
MTRRTLLAGLGAGAFLSLTRAQARSRIVLSPVRVERARVRRTVVGLRPYRPSGFVVRADKLGDRLLVHQYGHGGCGVTLSWGTARLAAELIPNGVDKRIAVLGAGAVGLATARVLQARGLEVTLYAREQSPNTCSDVAGARWYPFDVFDKKVVTPAFLALLWKVARDAYQAFRALPSLEYGIFDRPTYCFQRNPLPPTSLLNFDSPIHDLLPGLRDLAADEKPLDYPIVRSFQTMMIEPAIYLPALTRAITQAGGRFVHRELRSRAEVAALPEKTIVNCTGLGSAALFDDAELYPIKGQLTILEPQPEVDWVALPLARYMFPRKDGIILGGTFQHHVSTMEPDLEAEQRILDDHAAFFAQLAGR